jgi:hypothetical protein
MCRSISQISNKRIKEGIQFPVGSAVPQVQECRALAGNKGVERGQWY